VSLQGNTFVRILLAVYFVHLAVLAQVVEAAVAEIARAVHLIKR
jgi:hypothetical protein